MFSIDKGTVNNVLLLVLLYFTLGTFTQRRFYLTTREEISKYQVSLGTTVTVKAVSLLIMVTDHFITLLSYPTVLDFKYAYNYNHETVKYSRPLRIHQYNNAPELKLDDLSYHPTSLDIWAL